MVAGAGLGTSVLGGVTNLTSDTIAQNYALRKCKEADDKIKNDQERSANLERSETELTNAIVFFDKRSRRLKDRYNNNNEERLGHIQGHESFQYRSKHCRIRKSGL